MVEMPWIKRYSEAIVTGLIVCAVWALISYLEHKGLGWFYPFFYGMVGSGVVLVAAIAFSIRRRIPRPRIIPTENNIELCVRHWLDNHKIAVKNDPCEDAYFRFRITLGGGATMTILRPKLEFSDYVQAIADLGVRGDDKKLLEQFNNDDKAQILFDIKMELARAKVGYSGLTDSLEYFQIFRRLPIYPTLTEFTFTSMIFDVEAALHLVAIIFLHARWRKEKQLPIASSSLASNIPQLE